MTMASCKDCVHYNVCDYTSIIGKSMEKDCRDFKNFKNFINLPCKICDVVWTCLNGYVSKAKVWGISTENYLYEQQIYLKVRMKDKSNFVFDKTLLFGKTVFLTKEEAEQALKGGTDNG
jgi:hypothetical protein